jgi:AI-2 transport protein TqsA
MSNSLPNTDSRLQYSLPTLYAVAACLVIAAASWFLLKELASLLRPLFLAIFLAYIILPIQSRLRENGRGLVFRSAVVVAVLSAVVVFATLIYASIVDFSSEFPQLLRRGETIFHDARGYLSEHFPWLANTAEEASKAEEQGANRLRDAVGSLVNFTADFVAESLTVCIYLLFLSLEASRFPQRVRAGFTSERAESILAVVSGINEAMASYVKVKVKASLMLAIPVTLVLWCCGVKFGCYGER